MHIWFSDVNAQFLYSFDKKMMANGQTKKNNKLLFASNQPNKHHNIQCYAKSSKLLKFGFVSFKF